ncbi:Kinase, AGC NDR [Giardia muris]|uniref:non-specific serine/threonine protein kinase n=1 Tax=Giardia muris TaxID=5742 RepID=A0A4Z1T530_GIAMU|nr:Kinase, AGC NDR [Giardia muris]|eukprot:TNJ28197.1 Kinase, AGC NDR [Giardia muris]
MTSLSIDSLREYLTRKTLQFGELKRNRASRKELLEARLAERGCTEEQKKAYRQELRSRELQYLRLMRQNIGVDSFEKIQMLGRGAFGSVWLVRERATQRLFAMKQLRKEEMIKRRQIEHCITEKEIMASSMSDWIVRLHYSFQDEQYLYLVMEFAIGGDLMGLLIRVDTFPEPVAKFYMAQCCTSINEIHKMNSFYRDAKPDNFLIMENGHIKLSDFSLAKNFQTNRSNQNTGTSTTDSLTATLSDATIGLERSTQMDHVSISHNRAYSAVGTLDYSAVEIVRKDKSGYNHKVDWWSLGAILYECVFGYPPFASDTSKDSVKKIVNYKTYLRFPKDSEVSSECKDLISHLLCEPEERYDFDQIKAHPWFHDVDWNDLHSYTPPFLPTVSSPTDLKYFDFVQEQGTSAEHPVEAPATTKQYQWFSGGNHVKNYTYRNFPGTIDCRTETRTSLKDIFRDHDGDDGKKS